MSVDSQPSIELRPDSVQVLDGALKIHSTSKRFHLGTSEITVMVANEPLELDLESGQPEHGARLN